MNRFVVFAVSLSCLYIIAGAQESGDLRLVAASGSSSREGRVEIYLNEEWGTVKYNESGHSWKGTAQTICKQLGFPDQAKYGLASSLNFSTAAPTEDTPIWLTDVSCPDRSNLQDVVPHVLRCDHRIYNQSLEANHTYDMGVICSNGPKLTPYDTQVRLVQQNNSSFRSSGFLEIYLRGKWGPVCNIEQYDAETACRQLGYTGAAGYGDMDAYHPDPATPDRLDVFKCSPYSGSYPCLRNCFRYPASDSIINCTHHTFLNCTYDTTAYNAGTAYGTGSLCTKILPLTLIVAVSITVVVMVLLAVFIPLVTCCFCIPSIRNARTRNSYSTINT